MSKYKPLGNHLSVQTDRVVTLTFSEIGRIIGSPLPATAFRAPQWWENEHLGSHVQCRSWMDAGWRTRGVNLNSQTVEFYR